ncbi:NB-ARC domain-containing protein [Saccharothrix sp. AJ9571]|nr:NB-ARC domain-containing protein [Saccharothrix sp. AJ9571]
MTSTTTTTPRPMRTLGPGSVPAAAGPAPHAPHRPDAPPEVWGRIPARNLDFTGRADLLERLPDRLHSTTAAVVPVAVHGLGGIGKTQLATEYIYRHLEDYDLIWWIDAAHTSRIHTGLADLARTLGAPQARETDLAVSAVEVLRTGRPFRRWLLVFDGADDPATVLPHLPPHRGRACPDHLPLRRLGWHRAAAAAVHPGGEHRAAGPQGPRDHRRGRRRPRREARRPATGLTSALRDTKSRKERRHKRTNYDEDAETYGIQDDRCRLTTTLLLLFSGCGGGFPVTEDAELGRRLERVIAERRTVPLVEITGAGWDRVFLFPGEHTRRYVEKRVGEPLDMYEIDGGEHGGIVVFKRGAEVVRAVRFQQFPFAADGAEYGPTVVIGPPPQWIGGFVELTEN